MSDMRVLAEVKSNALRWGLIFGLLAGALLDTDTALEHIFPVTMASKGDLFALYALSSSIIFCGCAGFLAAHKTGFVAHGLQSGLYAGLVSGVVSIPLIGLLDYSFYSPYSEIVFRQIFAFSSEVGCSFGIYFILAISAGALGGKIAQRIQARTG